MDFNSSAVSNTSALSKRQALIVLVWICVLGLSIRLLHLWAITQSAWPQHHLMHSETDDHSFFEWAQTILAGDWLGRETYHPYFEWMKEIAPLDTWERWWGGKAIFHQPPLYPYLLATLLALCHGSVLCVFAIQLLLGSLQPLIMYHFTARIFSPLAGLVAAGLTALYGPFIFHEAVLLRDWLPPLLEPLALLAILRAEEKGHRWAWTLAGAALGLALLARETVWLLIPLVFLWMLVGSGRTLTRVVWNAGCLALGVLLCLSPLIARNLAVGAPPLSLSTRAAEAVIMANTPNLSKAALADVLTHSQGRLFPTIRETVKTYQGDWGRFLRMARWKLQVLKDAYEYPNNVSVDYGMDISPILRWSVGYGIVFPLGLAGFVLFGRQSRATGLVTLYMVGTVAWLLLISPLSRYRLGLAPPLIVFAGATLVFLMNGIRQRNLRLVAIVLGLILAGIVLQRAIFPFPEESKNYAYIPDYIASARAYAEAGQYDRAAAEMARLIQKSGKATGSPPPARYLVADYLVFQAQDLILRGRLPEARKNLEEAVAIFSHPPQKGEKEVHYPWFNFGLVYLKLDEPAKARQALEKFIELDPRNPLAERAGRLLRKLEVESGEPAPTER